MDGEDRLTDDDIIEQAYDIFLELAPDNLDPADVLLFKFQFEQRGAAELFDPSERWRGQVDLPVNPNDFAEVVIGLAEQDGMPVDDVFARMLLSRDRTAKICHILWKE
ncbi:HI1450 family dsDNA-mimic protein [Martelella alba]|uniref:DUF440 family protein n=1 Tax=Martelella alba TaxID=2590451 RepID=A0ABY2SQ13_9HYPH|nr:HI1450 family dsDNA-mimic protein [Martelella alba]TKI08148.1 DUF440 family protein [Martelella alba]